MDLFWSAIVYLNGFILAFLLFQSLLHLLQLIFAYIEVRYFFVNRHREPIPWWLLTSGVSMPISIPVPAYNEAETWRRTSACRCRCTIRSSR